MRTPEKRSEPPIDSPRNQRARWVRALEDDKSLRLREGLYLAWGIHLGREALNSGASVQEAMVGPLLERGAEGRRLLISLQSRGIPILRAATRVLDSIIPGCGDQGILLVVRRPSHTLTAITGRKPALVLVAHGVQDPGNLGSILRTAGALGSEAVIVLEGCADPFGSRSVRAAMGAQFTLPVAVASTSETLGALADGGLQIVAADSAGGRRPFEIDFRAPTALVVGNEGGGLPPAILDRAAARVRIPMVDRAESLNVHAAVVALLYEAARQRSFAGLR